MSAALMVVTGNRRQGQTPRSPLCAAAAPFLAMPALMRAPVIAPMLAPEAVPTREVVRRPAPASVAPAPGASAAADEPLGGELRWLGRLVCIATALGSMATLIALAV